MIVDKNSSNMQYTQYKGLPRHVGNTISPISTLHSVITLLSLLTILAFTLSACSDSAKQDTIAPDNKKVEQIKKISMSKPSLALSMLDSAEVLHTMPMCDVNALRAIVYNNSSNNNVKALHYAMLASTDSMLTHNDKKRMDVAAVLAYQYFKCGSTTDA